VTRASAGAALFALALGVAEAVAGGRPAYPPAPRSGQVDVYHGERVADPWRPLESLDDPATVAWVRAQDALARKELGGLPLRARFAARMRELVDYERFGLPQHRGGRYLYTRIDGKQEQDVLWITTDPREPGRVLLDPNALSADGTVSLDGFELSPDGRHVAYALSDGGSDWETWRVRDTATGADLPEVLGGTKFTGIAWRRDGAGFYYSRYPALAGRGDAWDDGRQVAIWYHALGTPQSRDVEVYAITDHPTRNPYPEVSEDGRYLVIHVDDGFETSGVYYRRLGAAPGGAGEGPVVRLLDAWDGLYDYLGNDGDVFLVKTTAGAPAGRIVAIDLAAPGRERWREVVPERAEAIAEASLVGGQLVVQYVVDVKSVVRTFDLAGRPGRVVALPGAGTVEGFDGEAGDTEAFYAYTDFTTPRAVYRYDLATGRSEPWRVPRLDFDPSAYVTRQVRYRSRDGTEVPMYLVHRRDLAPGTPHPTVLYGYGGFNVSLLPSFSASRAAWIEAGGIYAVANLRGGGEFGERWHRAGTKLAKQNVFDDFIAAAEWLERERWTTPGQLAIWGGSNGGLLVGAVLNQRPELFAAAVPAVGVMDMLRYPLASANARQWSSDYGLSEVPEEFRALRAYSPYHNVRAGTCYPPVLVMADANDDRVVPWHSYKYAAALQAAQGCDRPVLLRVETRAGHGAGASTTKIVEEYADQWAFVAAATGLKPR
jgi:prolyl oligopeptidase